MSKDQRTLISSSYLEYSSKVAASDKLRAEEERQRSAEAKHINGPHETQQEKADLGTSIYCDLGRVHGVDPDAPIRLGHKHNLILKEVELSAIVGVTHLDNEILNRKE